MLTIWFKCSWKIGNFTYSGIFGKNQDVFLKIKNVFEIYDCDEVYLQLWKSNLLLVQISIYQRFCSDFLKRSAPASFQDSSWWLLLNVLLEERISSFGPENKWIYVYGKSQKVAKGAFVKPRWCFQSIFYLLMCLCSLFDVVTILF